MAVFYFNAKKWPYRGLKGTYYSLSVLFKTIHGCLKVMLGQNIIKLDRFPPHENY